MNFDKNLIENPHIKPEPDGNEKMSASVTRLHAVENQLWSVLHSVFENLRQFYQVKKSMSKFCDLIVKF